MNTPANPPSFLARIPLAIRAMFTILFDAQYASRVLLLDEVNLAPVPAPAPAPTPAPVPAPIPTPAPELLHADTASSLQLLALLQRDARLIDFTQEDLRGYSDADIGAAARVVHEGCAKVLSEHFTLQALRSEAEGSRITLPVGFDASTVRLSGNVVGSAPFTGTLTHKGWRALDVRLPKLSVGHDASILAQAEVEL